ncbi:MAG TPA: dihydropteroate synthase [Candidatus Latescibacteria bacterium]|nr:dihydropteroate synthase [Candidatus Latescibacterota bacterium]
MTKGAAHSTSLFLVPKVLKGNHVDDKPAPSLKIDCRGKLLDAGAGTLIMGILNVTPDSFSDGGRFLEPRIAVERAHQMVEEGADIIDIGGESTRPAGPYGEGADTVSEEEECQRTLPVIQELASQIDVSISIDTTKAAVAGRALEAGAALVNDISALRFDSEMAETVAEFDAPVVLMHMKDTPETMQCNPVYDDLMGDIVEFLRNSRDRALKAGVGSDRIIVDPGLGFGKTYNHNFQIIARLRDLEELACPILIGPSRKKFVGAHLDLPPSERLEGTLAAIALSVIGGAQIVRVHDVREARKAIVVADQVAEQAGRPCEPSGEA